MEQFVGDQKLKNRLSKFNSSSIWKTLLNLTSEQVLLIDKNGKILFTNNPIFGTSPEDALGKSLYKLTPSTYLLILQSNLEEVSLTKKSASFETLYKVGKRLRSYEITIKPILGETNDIQGFALASVDTTEIKFAKRRYSYKMNLEKLFLNISTKFISLPASQIDNGLQESLELIGRFTNSEHAYIVLKNENTNQIGYQWHFNYSNTTDKMCSIFGLEELIGNALSRTDFTDPKLIRPHVDNEGRSLDCPVFLNPMILEKKQYGALVLLGKINAQEDWSEDFAKPMMLFTNVFINTLERKKNALIEEQRQEALEKAIKERTIEIELQKNKLLKQAEELKQADTLVRYANNELKKSNSKLEKTVSERTSSLEKTNQELDRFVYSVSHDIKAPLASVKGLINLIRLSTEDELEYNLQLMDRSINKLNGFVEDILMHSRNSRVALKQDLINFDKEIELAAEDLRHMDKASDVKLITSIEIKAAAVTDQYRLQSVLKNLISNSVKYHNPDAKKSWVKVFVKSTTAEIQIKVSDNGIGINQLHVDKIFDMFYRASEHSFGSGLGLYIVKETVEKLGGTIKVTSKENVGSTFELSIPNLSAVHA
jgi:PAS domain S-box-containing protein